MAYSFEFDSANGILLARFRGQVTDEQLGEFYRVATPKLVAGLDFRGVINDFSEVTSFDVTPETVRALAWSQPAVADSSKIRIIVAPTPKVYGMARMFALHGEDTRPNLHVVQSLEHAYAVFGLINPKFQKIGEADGAPGKGV